MRFYRNASLIYRVRNKDFTGFINEFEIKNLRISFSILKSLAFDTNKATVKIYNLSQSHRNEIKNFGDQVTLKAGYDISELNGTPQILFLGDTTSVSHVYESPDIVTYLECGDGERYLNNIPISITTGSEISARTVLENIAKQIGIELQLSISDDLVYYNGFKYIGLGKEALARVCQYLNLQASVQNGVLQIIPIYGTTPAPPIPINETTGMQGIPIRYTYRRIFMYRPIENPSAPNAFVDSPQAQIAPTTGYKVNMMLNPLIIPGARIDLQSTHIQYRGVCRVENIRHDGDTYGSPWTSQLELTELG